MIWNPWERIRQLEQDAIVQQAFTDQWMTEMERRVRDAENDAFYRAFDHYQMRTAHLRAQNESMMESMVNLANLNPSPMIISGFDVEQFNRELAGDSK